MPKKKLSLAKQYPNSKMVNKCLLKVTARMKEKPAACEHNKVGYDDLMYLLKQSQKVVANLAKTLASMEEKFDDAEKAAKSDKPSELASIEILDIKFDKSRIKLNQRTDKDGKE